MNFKKILLSLALCSLSMSIFAQTVRDKVVFDAIQTEMERTRGIKMGAQFPSPYYMGFYMEDSRSMSITSQLGSVVSFNYEPLKSRIGADMYLGDSNLTSRLDYSGKMPSITATSDNNELSIKNSMWTLNDYLYKNALKDIQNKVTALKQLTLDPLERNMVDFITINHTNGESTTGVMPSYDKEKWSDLCNKLSALMLKYPDIKSSNVILNANTKTFYIVNTNGLKLKQTYHYIVIGATANAQATDGSMLSNSMSVISTDEGKLPSLADLEKSVNAMATKLVEMRDVAAIADYYNGPVLFIDQAAMTAISTPLISSMVASKNFSRSGWSLNPIERRMDKKVLDNKLTVKNYTDKKEHKGKELIGYYDIDADGIKPKGEMTLIENGILKQMLLGKSESAIVKSPTGSTRMILTGKELAKSVLPGTLHISTNGGMKIEAMKKMLLKLAKEEGLEFAYIIANTNAGCPEIYRVNVKTGKQSLVSSVQLPNIDMSMLRRIPAVSSEEQVINRMVGGTLMSVIVPKAIILNDIELDVRKTNKSTPPFMNSPLKRAK